MDIRISKESDVPLRQQVAEQIVLLIATEKLKPGTPIPSVRELARRLKIHHNTVSHAYAELVRRTWLVRKPGSNLVVRSPRSVFAVRGRATAPDLDDLMNQTIAAARERGFTLQELRDKIRAQLEIASGAAGKLKSAVENGDRKVVGVVISQLAAAHHTLEDLKQ